MPRVFISYARADGRSTAAVIRDLLSDPMLTDNKPVAIWQDLTSMRSGEWREQIRTAIGECDHLVMILTPHALASEACAWEWYLARREGIEISPIIAERGFDLATLPKWMTAQHIYRIALPARPFFRLSKFFGQNVASLTKLCDDPEWSRLVASLHNPKQPRRMPIISRTTGARFVERPVEMNALRKLLLDARGDAIAVTTAFTGSGGMGKTTLALALAHDQRVQTAFYGGQLLLELGQEPNLLLILQSAVQAITGNPASSKNEQAASEELAATLVFRP